MRRADPFVLTVADAARDSQLWAAVAAGEVRVDLADDLPFSPAGTEVRAVVAAPHLAGGDPAAAYALRVVRWHCGPLGPEPADATTRLRLTLPSARRPVPVPRPRVRGWGPVAAQSRPLAAPARRSFLARLLTRVFR